MCLEDILRLDNNLMMKYKQVFLIKDELQNSIENNILGKTRKE